MWTSIWRRHIHEIPIVTLLRLPPLRSSSLAPTTPISLTAMDETCFSASWLAGTVKNHVYYTARVPPGACFLSYSYCQRTVTAADEPTRTYDTPFREGYSGGSPVIQYPVDTSYRENAFASARIRPNVRAWASVFISWTMTSSSILTCFTPQRTQCSDRGWASPERRCVKGRLYANSLRLCVSVHSEWPFVLGSRSRRDRPTCSRP